MIDLDIKTIIAFVGFAVQIATFTKLIITLSNKTDANIKDIKEIKQTLAEQKKEIDTIKERDFQNMTEIKEMLNIISSDLRVCQAKNSIACKN